MPAQAGRPPCGAPLTPTQLPGAAAVSHASHWPSHAELQHTPSTQKPLSHSPVDAQLAPALFFGAHTPAEQNCPVEQSDSVAQVPRQAVAPQR